MSDKNAKEMCYMTEQPVTDWVPSTADFSARLALVRNKMDWNQREAALACGLPAQSWREWESLRRRPRDYCGTVLQIAKHTGANMTWLMTGAMPGEPPPGGWAEDRSAPRGTLTIVPNNDRAVDDEALRWIELGGGDPTALANNLLPRLDSNQEPSD